MTTSIKTQAFNRNEFKAAVTRHLVTTFAKTVETATEQDWYLALGRALAESTTANLLATEQNLSASNSRSVNYLSLEFLIGRLTGNNLINMDLYDDVAVAMSELGLNLSDLLEEERDPALGNGGLGRLAACFMESLAAQEFPAVGYGLHYEYGLFRQSFDDGEQQEAPDAWRGEQGYPWEVQRPELTKNIGLYGSIETYIKENGNQGRRWVPALFVEGIAWDLPIVGYKNDSVYPLRLWECKTSAPFNLQRFDQGDYLGAQFSAIEAGNVTKVLYPNDNHDSGKTLRLMQQYFHCACSIADILERHLAAGHALEDLAKLEAIQLNDTHPTIAIPELMRILIDEYELSWDSAWAICSKTFAYTNHTLLPEALEKWSEALIGQLLPRHLEIIFEINARFMTLVEKQWPGDNEKKAKLSIIEEGHQRMVRMANLCVVSTYAVNGVAALHSELVKRDLFPEFDQLFPGKLQNVTNGVTPRRWLKYCNPDLAELFSNKIGDEWVGDLDKLKELEKYADDPQFQQQFMAAKKVNKQRLADWIKENMDIEIDTNAIFDVQIKRLHEYKRQHLNLLNILALYHRLLNDADFDMHPRVFIFGAKAAPGYALAKEIIHAINKVADTVNNDKRINGKLKVVFMPDYRVSLAEMIIPAADVSEQISTAGKEASGTGNMKLALNGALTIGTMDGANVEIREEVGDENIFIFGLLVDEVLALKASGYKPYDYYNSDSILRASLDMLGSDRFTPGNPNAFAGIRHNLLDGGDPYLVLADFASYVNAHERIDRAYRDQSNWAKMAIINSVSVGKFSSDRSIRDYANNIWKLKSVKSQ
ncbi:glycogen/starch/alpha-glucan phosphorylase [Vibrio sp. SS-MA-C1-2]|uniref:glycogen/starch/alpha-glucan phosphorylase n=1 Tax=Vibrio sp. SS-MA-C1-2 TaxID=2908646 RepID=UPI001F3BC86E|nr:glycogen/starch/alpha-glucan phosphorylase [Vibrio sp. SS-MA-C1-2]UJF17499.1 glycogen/starch/alpha-glucan phosphorylase [Vibrio sp. SS-MA-C1-2]